MSIFKIFHYRHGCGYVVVVRYDEALPQRCPGCGRSDLWEILKAEEIPQSMKTCPTCGAPVGEQRVTIETPQEHIRNALAMLAACAVQHHDVAIAVVEHSVVLSQQDYLAIWDRLFKAVAQLEGT